MLLLEDLEVLVVLERSNLIKNRAFKMIIEIPNMGITAYIARENAFYLAISFFILATILNVLRNFSLLEWNCVFVSFHEILIKVQS